MRFKRKDGRQLCECNCTGLANPGRRFINGHNTRANPPMHNPETAKKNAKARKGQKRPTIKGDLNPSKRPEVAKQISIALTGRSKSKEICQKISETLKGRKNPDHSEYMKEKQ